MKQSNLVKEKLGKISGTYEENTMFKSLIQSDENLLKDFQLFCDIYKSNDFIEQKFLSHPVPPFVRNKNDELEHFNLKEWKDIKNKIDSFDTQNFDFSNIFFKKVSLKSGELSFVYDSYNNDNEDYGEFEFGDESKFNNNETSVLAKTTEVVINKVFKL
ncbi:hypothetical protein NPA07_05445 [Mycoplasmopsis caviae]|uniref:Uncharacterized protein n=1 Tax=Mycoplasmopsis caviae TaxID=55603 RepID=A0A3P8KMH0_9BACT|nr:hypothetical protein [Mycoplasmopsis caviae]UUD35217.1 hypothetical protein NPA07_05445 [Mycoplasmopsis caviae]VDR41998.1 Uncharacterised protein [Mycoplasmopsis caviae]